MKDKFRRTYNLAALEREYSYLAKGGDRHLSARDVLKLFDNTKTPYGNYWPKPVEKELDAALSKHRVRLGPVPKDEVAFIDGLLRHLHSVGIVSLLLRFTHPDCYAIFSTPVVSLLQIQRPRSAELYVAYCEELREWTKHFRMDSVAQTELGLWVYYSLSSPQMGAEAEQHLRAFQSDMWIQRRRLTQSLGPFLKTYGPLELARILVYLDPNLAGKIAGEEYEKRLRTARNLYCPRVPFKAGWAEAMLNQLMTLNIISMEENVALREVWSIRNLSVHAGQQPTPEQVEKMIDAVERICNRWAAEAPPLAKP